MKKEKNLWLQDIKKTEYIAGIIKTFLRYAVMIYIFYESFWPALVLFPVWIMYLKFWLEDISRAKSQEFRSQFRDGIQSMASAMKAGYSVENSIREAVKDLLPVYGKDTRIIKEYTRMIHRMDINVPFSSVLEEFSERTGQEDAENFVNVFMAAKISGGDSISIIRNAVRIISEKIDTEKEIDTMLASKKMEFEIMCAVPFIIILYMKMTFGEFLEVLYGNLPGIIVMSLCFAVYVIAYCLGRYIIRIEV